MNPIPIMYVVRFPFKRSPGAPTLPPSFHNSFRLFAEILEDTMVNPLEQIFTQWLLPIGIRLRALGGGTQRNL